MTVSVCWKARWSDAENRPRECELISSVWKRSGLTTLRAGKWAVASGFEVPSREEPPFTRNPATRRMAPEEGGSREGSPLAGKEFFLVLDTARGPGRPLTVRPGRAFPSLPSTHRPSAGLPPAARRSGGGRCLPAPGGDVPGEAGGLRPPRASAKAQKPDFCLAHTGGNRLQFRRDFQVQVR